jgi:hypothetical protein
VLGQWAAWLAGLGRKTGPARKRFKGNELGLKDVWADIHNGMQEWVF